MAFELPPLPYAKTALEPHTSAQTLDFHHGKHHQTYVTNLNNLVKDTPMASQSLEQIIQATAKDESKIGIFNNAAQVWNHTFFWNCMKPGGGGSPSGDVAAAIEKIGGLQKFKDDFKAAALAQFGSGWAWLVAKDGKLEVMASADADTPMAHGIDCLLTIDVWEHAYYLDYRHQRERYVAAVIDQLLDWEFAEKNLG